MSHSYIRKRVDNIINVTGLYTGGQRGLKELVNSEKEASGREGVNEEFAERAECQTKREQGGGKREAGQKNVQDVR